MNTKLLMQPYFLFSPLYAIMHLNFYLDIRIGDAAHVHGGELHRLDDGHGEGLGVEVILEFVLKLAQILLDRALARNNVKQSGRFAVKTNLQLLFGRLQVLLHRVQYCLLIDICLFCRLCSFLCQ